ncbi:MAG: DeoR/GlpR transcriptional regulator, partial [Clostridia bacterium]|nr:DeoR/GlpR transcriptional regulator [Clostridia bacterium]
MFAVERQKIILDSLKEHGAVQVSKLSQELGVTEETVRRDLEKLEKNELLIRTHGG